MIHEEGPVSKTAAAANSYLDVTLYLLKAVHLDRHRDMYYHKSAQSPAKILIRGAYQISVLQNDAFEGHATLRPDPPARLLNKEWPSASSQSLHHSSPCSSFLLLLSPRLP